MNDQSCSLLANLGEGLDVQRGSQAGWDWVHSRNMKRFTRLVNFPVRRQRLACVQDHFCCHGTLIRVMASPAAILSWVPPSLRVELSALANDPRLLDGDEPDR